MKSAKSNLIAACSVVLAFSAVWGCSDHNDDEKYRSQPPEISDMTVTGLDGSSTLRTGDKLLATVVQSTKGRLLYRATYEWSSSPSDGVSLSPNKKGVVYDNENDNPTDTIVFSTPGTYTITFSGTYNISGGYEHHNKTVDIENGTIVYSTPNWL